MIYFEYFDESIFIIHTEYEISLWVNIMEKYFSSNFMLNNQCWKEAFRLLIVRFAPVKYYNFAGMNG